MALTNEQRRRIVHIGVSDVFPGDKGTQVKPGEIHVCYEMNPAVVEIFEEIKAKAKINDKKKYKLLQQVRVMPHVLDGRATGLPDESVDEVHIHNVLCVPLMPESEQINFLQEAKRILRPNGKIYIGHTSTPEDCTKEQLIALGKRLELSGNLIHDDEGKRNEKKLAVIMGRDSAKFRDEGSYLMQFRK